MTKKRLLLLLILLLSGTACAQQPETLVVAAVSCDIKIRDTAHNLQRIDFWSKKAAAKKADLVLFPECTLHGWWQSRENRKYAEPLCGKSLDRVKKIARNYNLTLAVGMTEKHAGKYFLTHVLVGPEGIIGFHRKSSLAGGKNGEASVWDVGNDTNVFDVKGFKVGIAICFESVHPQTCQKLKQAGAELILAPFANGTLPSEVLDPGRQKRKWIWDRVRENRLWYVACDATSHDKQGNLQPGAAYIISPSQKLIACTSPDVPGEAMVIGTLSKQSVKN